LKVTKSLNSLKKVLLLVKMIRRTLYTGLTALALSVGGSALANDAPSLEHVSGAIVEEVLPEEYFPGFQHIDETTYQQEVRENPGVTVMVWYSSCGSDKAEEMIANVEGAWAELMPGYQGKVKFVAADNCGKFHKSESGEWQSRFGPGSTGLTTHFFIDGKPIFNYAGSNDVDVLVGDYSTRLANLLSR